VNQTDASCNWFKFLFFLEASVRLGLEDYKPMEFDVKDLLLDF